jgi:hypothetical protein
MNEAGNRAIRIADCRLLIVDCVDRRLPIEIVGC